jgi:hypothetical protein
MILDDLLTKFEEKRFEFDCPQMELTQANATNPVTFKGKGFVRQTSDDQLEFKMFATETAGTDQADWLRRQLSATSGKLFADADYYDLNVTDINGRRWIAERILPNCTWSFVDDSPNIVGKIPLLCTVDSPRIVSNYLNLHYFDECKLPWIEVTKSEGGQSWKRDHVRFSVGVCDFLIRQHNLGFRVEVKSEKPIPAHLPTRIDEAFQYFLSKSVYWRIRTRSVDNQEMIEIVSGRAGAKGNRLGPPLASGASGFYECGWSLFTKYLQYILESTPHPYWNHCTYHLHNAREVSAGSLDSWAVGVSVAVEGIADLLPHPGGCHSSRRETEELIKEVLHLFEATTRFQHSRPRLEALLDSMLNVRPDDCLAPLVASNHVSADHIKAWRRLRNKHVHPRRNDLKKMTQGDHQELIDLVYRTTVLMYHMTFYIIGYQGKYIDYGSPGWPSMDYPPKTT